MRPMDDFDPEEIRRLLREEAWDHPLPEVRRIRLRPWQGMVFWGLRAYVAVMVIIVILAFGHGMHG